MKRITRKHIKNLEKEISEYGPEYLPYLSPFDNDWEWGARNDWVDNFWKKRASDEIESMVSGAETTRDEIAAKRCRDIAEYSEMMRKRGDFERAKPGYAERRAIEDQALGAMRDRLGMTE